MRYETGYAAFGELFAHELQWHHKNGVAGACAKVIEAADAYRRTANLAAPATMESTPLEESAIGHEYRCFGGVWAKKGSVKFWAHHGLVTVTQE